MLRRPAAARLRRPAGTAEATIPEHGDIHALPEAARNAALSAFADEAWSEPEARQPDTHETKLRSHRAKQNVKDEGGGSSNIHNTNFGVLSGRFS